MNAGEEAGRGRSASLHQEREFGLGFGTLHLFALSGFALAQPLFDVLGREATFFVEHDLGGAELVLFVLLLVGGFPLALVGIEAALSCVSRRLGRAARLVFVSLLVALIVLPVAKRAGLGGRETLALALASGGLAGVLYARWTLARSFLSLLACAPPVFALMFLATTPVGRLVSTVQAADVVVSAAPSETTVVFLVLDELPLAGLLERDLTIDEELFPNFARLAADSLWLRNATANHAYTNQVVPALLTGRLPAQQRIPPTLREHPDNLFALLAGSHRIVADEVATRLCAPEWNSLADEGGAALRWEGLLRDVSLVFLHMALPEALATRLPPVSETWGGFGGGGDDDGDGLDTREDATRQFDAFLGQLAADAEPTLYYLHLMLPHKPWNRLRNGKRYAESARLVGKGRSPGIVRLNPEVSSELSMQRFLFQLGHVDRLLGELMERLEATGLYERALVVVAGDHGATFEPGHHRRNPDPTTVRDILHVPLFLKLPGQRAGRVSDRNVESIDVLPSVAEALGLEVPWKLDGVSFLDDERAARPDKRIGSKAGLPMILDGDLPRHWPLLARRLATFGSAEGWEDIEAFGPWKKLVGRPLADFRISAATSIVPRVDGYSLFEGVDTASDFSVSFLRGRLVGDGTPLPTRLAFSVNGIIRTVSGVLSEGPTVVECGVFLPDAAFRDGRNDVRIFGIVDEDELTAFEVFTYRLDVEVGAIVRSDGRAYPLRPGVVDGGVNAAPVRATFADVSGWAADLVGGRPADLVVFVFEDGLTLDVPIGLPSPALADQTGQRALRKSAFGTKVPLELGDGDLTGKLRAFALLGDSASELEFHGPAAWLRAP